MKSDKLKNILEDLYSFYPDLKKHEKELKELVLKMIENKPEIKFDESFALDLKGRLMSSLNLNKKNTNKFNFNIMNRRIFVAAGSLVALSIVFIAAISFYTPNKNNDSVWNIASLISNKNREVAVSELAPNSFGSLRTLSYVAGGEGRSLEPDSDLLRQGHLGDSERSMVTATMGSEIEDDMSLRIMPYSGVRYVYTGEDLNLDDISSLVYKQIKDQDEITKSLAKNLSSFDFPGIDLKTFDNLRVSNISFSEDKDRGLMLNFELKNGMLSIYENWEKWAIPEIDACGADAECYNKYRVRISDMPSNDSAISIANDFLADHNIDTTNYSEPQMDTNWLNYYEAAEDKDDYYFPTQVAVIYPLLIDGQKVRDQNGYLSGLSVDINVMEKKVSGLHGLMPYKFQSSSYDLVRDTERIIALAEDGGYSRSYYGLDDENIRELELDTPEFSYAKMWRQVNNVDEDILVPALMFPVIKKASEPYYGVDYVVVPLVEELIEELEKEGDAWPLIREGRENFVDSPSILPMPMISPDEAGM